MWYNNIYQPGDKNTILNRVAFLTMDFRFRFRQKQGDEKMYLLFTHTIATSIGKAVGSYLMGKGADYALEQASFKAKIKRIIRQDKKYIRQKFSDLKYREYPIEEFFLERIFQDQYFLYTFDTFPVDKSEELYKRFQNYVLGKGMDFRSIREDENFRPMLEDCVNNHNVLVHRIMLDPSQQLLEKDMKEYMTATGYTGHTLDPMAVALGDNPELEYVHRQIDGILRALRMDLRFYRLALVMCTISLMVIAPVVVALYANYRSVHIAMIAAALCIVTGISILLFDVLAGTKIIYCEKTIKKYTEALWQKNFERYSNIIQNERLLDDGLDNYRQYLSEVRYSLWERENWLDAKERSLREKEKQLQKQEDE